MSDPSVLFGDFCDALNAELAAVGCNLRVDRVRPGPQETMLLLDEKGSGLGWLPEHVDAASIAAFALILERRAIL